jgi:hypothetical protein
MISQSLPSIDRIFPIQPSKHVIFAKHDLHSHIFPILPSPHMLYPILKKHMLYPLLLTNYMLLPFQASNHMPPVKMLSMLLILCSSHMLWSSSFHIKNQRGQCILFLSSLPLLSPVTTAVFGSYLSSL